MLTIETEPNEIIETVKGFFTEGQMDANGVLYTEKLDNLLEKYEKSSRRMKGTMRDQLFGRSFTLARIAKRAGWTDEDVYKLFGADFDRNPGAR